MVESNALTDAIDILKENSLLIALIMILLFVTLGVNVFIFWFGLAFLLLWLLISQGGAKSVPRQHTKI